MKVRIRIVERSGRLRAVMESEEGIIAEWWVESTSHRRYRPLKPIPPHAQLILQSLDARTLQRIATFLMISGSGESIEFEAKAE